MAGVVAPLLHKKLYGGSPPVTEVYTEPLLRLHRAGSGNTTTSTAGALSEKQRRTIAAIEFLMWN